MGSTHLLCMQWASAKTSGEGTRTSHTENTHRMLTSSGGGGQVRWRDCTLELEQKGAAEAQARMEQEQELSTAVFSGQFGKAMKLAMKLRQPRALRTVMEKLLTTPDGEEQLKATLAVMDADGLTHCLTCSRDWNTTAAHSLTAHRLLNAMLQAAAIPLLPHPP